jgi:hypothetical protein
MLVRFVYLDTLALADYAAQLDGGTLVETKTRQMKKRGGGAKLGVGPVSMNVDLRADGEHAQTFSHPSRGVPGQANTPIRAKQERCTRDWRQLGLSDSG